MISFDYVLNINGISLFPLLLNGCLLRTSSLARVFHVLTHLINIKSKEMVIIVLILVMREQLRAAAQAERKQL